MTLDLPLYDLFFVFHCSLSTTNFFKVKMPLTPTAVATLPANVIVTPNLIMDVAPVVTCAARKRTTKRVASKHTRDDDSTSTDKSPNKVSSKKRASLLATKTPSAKRPRKSATVGPKAASTTSSKRSAQSVGGLSTATDEQHDTSDGVSMTPTAVMDPVIAYGVPLQEIILATTRHPYRCKICHAVTMLSARDKIIECGRVGCGHPVLYKPRRMTVETYDTEF